VDLSSVPDKLLSTGLRRRGLIVGVCLLGFVGTLWARDWPHEFQLGIWLVRSEFPLRDLDHLTDDLAELEADLNESLHLEPSERPIHVHLFSTKYSYSKYLAARVPQGTKRKALFVRGNDVSRVYAYRTSELPVDVRHEATHALLHNSLPYVPLWLDEGLAEYFEVARPLRRQQHPHQSEIRWAIRFGWTPDLARLERLKRLEDMGGRDYRDAWAWVHFLMHGPPAAQEALHNYLSEIQSGAAPTPLSERLPEVVPQLADAIRDHFR
jgi:hypothetical protein